MVENLRGACPPHKRKDLDALFKSLNGDEEKIRQKIQQWWEEPQAPQEEKWEDVNKKASKHKKQTSGGTPGPAGRIGRAVGPGRGRGHRGGGGADRRERGGRGGPRHQRQQQQQAPANATQLMKGETTKKEVDRNGDVSSGPQQLGVPSPVTNTPALKGAWGARAVSTTTPIESIPASASETSPTENTKTPKAVSVEKEPVAEPQPANVESLPVDHKAIQDKEISAPRGNVWATRGSAHLIRAVQPKPPSHDASSAPSLIASAVVPIVTPVPSASLPETSAEAEEPEPVDESMLQQTESLVTEGGSVPSPVVAHEVTESWDQRIVSASPIPSLVQRLENNTTDTGKPSSPVSTSPELKGAISAHLPVPVDESISPIERVGTISEANAPEPQVPTIALNMGHWETENDDDEDDSQNDDFGFETVGADGAAASGLSLSSSCIPSQNSPDENVTSAGAPSASPARPPPGLTISGMPPIPANAVLVHELENNLEKASKNVPPNDQSIPSAQNKPLHSSLPAHPSHIQSSQETSTPVLPAGGISQQNYNQQYGMGMYNYTATGGGNGFMGMHPPAGTILPGGIVPPPGGKPQQIGGPGQTINPGQGPVGPQAHHQQPGLYGSQSHTAPSSGNPVAGADGTNDNPSSVASANIPPGMPLPYSNPPLYYSQHQFHMGQHQGGLGYNYGYGAQFGGAVQGGFGYQQVMSQNANYGGPQYDDPPHQGASQHPGNSNNYQKTNSGENGGNGYRGRNSHHNNQYQNQYTPQQHGGYGGQPYNMTYHNDHFNPNQRGGYGPNGMNDPYNLQQQQQQQGSTYQANGIQSGGFHDEDQHHKNKKGSNRGNGFQQGTPNPLGTQQSFGLQVHGSESNNPATAAGGGWTNQSGWGVGSPSWQGS